MKGQHSCATPEHGTEERMVKLARTVVGVFNIDPASSAKWNRVIGAERFIDKKQNGLRTPWMRGAPAPHKLAGITVRHRAGDRGRCVAIVNPPGDPKGELVAGFWCALSAYFELGWLSSAIWIGFSLEQLARLQRVGAPSHPLNYPTLIPSRRLHYSKQPGVAGKQPTHASFVTLLSRSRQEVSAFSQLSADIGTITRSS